MSNGFVGGPAGVSYYFQKGAPSWVDASLLPSGTVPGDGEWIVGQGRVSGTFLQPQLLNEFPFDTQVRRRGGAGRGTCMRMGVPRPPPRRLQDAA